MKVQHFFDERTSTLSYAVLDERSRSAVVVDPVLDFEPRNGRTSEASCEAVARWLDRHADAVPFVLDTHAHADHFSGLPFFRTRYGARTVIGSRIARVQETFRDLYGLGGDFPIDGRPFDVLLEDGEALEAGGLRVEAMHTPGHTPACMTYRIGDTLFVGDTLFMPDYGTARCDFPGGSAEAMYESIQRLYALPAELRVYTCHDYRPRGRALRFVSTIGEERRSNIQITAETSRGEFVAMREKRDASLPLPDLMLAAIQVNVRAGLLPKPSKSGIAYLKIPLNVF